MKHLYSFTKHINTKSVFLQTELSSAAVEEAETFENSDMVMIGDSLTVGMAQQIPGVRTDSEVGRSIRNMPAAMQRALNLEPQPKVISIMGGTNDGGDLATVRNAYTQMLAAAQAAGVKVVIATLPPLRGNTLDETNAYIRSLASDNVSVVELSDNPVGSDNVHFAEYGTPANEVLAVAQAAVSGAETNTVIDLLRGRITPGAVISDGAVEAAAARIAASLPQNLNLEALLDEAMEGHPEIDEDEDIAALSDRVDDLIEEENEDREVAALTPEETTQLQTMSNLEFLELPTADRLRLITTQNITSEEVSTGEIDNLTFTFTFGGESQNDALWRDTTAGQVLPAQVRSASSGGVIYSRSAESMRGEFFSETGARLKIHEGTNLNEISTDEEAVVAAQARVSEQMETFEGSDDEALVVQLALEHNIPAAFTMAAFVAQGHDIETEAAPDLTSDEARLGAMPGAETRQQLTPAYRAQLEDFLTDVGRVEGSFNGRYPDESAREGDRLNANFASYFLAEGSDPRKVGEIMLSAGYSQAEIEASAAYAAARQEQNSSGGTNPLNAEILNSGEVDVVPAKQDMVNSAVEGAMANKSRYEAVAARVGVAWELIAGIHFREGSYNFDTYLHNGQPLGQTTTIVPVGKYFTNWEDAAVDALTGGYGNPSENDLASQANFAERFNGLGYRNRGLTSPYVWAGHSSYENQGGMFVSDGQFDRSARDGRVGVMPIVMVLRSRQGKSNSGAPAMV